MLVGAFVLVDYWRLLTFVDFFLSLLCLGTDCLRVWVFVGFVF